MFGKLMNNYYYGKSGKGDYTPDDLPKNRWQLFLEMLRTRFSALMRLNLMYVVSWIFAIMVIMGMTVSIVSLLSYVDDEKAGTSEVVEIEEGETVTYEYISTQEFADQAYGIFFYGLLLLVPAIAITGPFTAGVCYVTRNWARDEHAFIWSDFKDAVKANWKQSLVISLITGLMPVLVFLGWRFYGSYAASNPLMTIPQVLILMVGILWSLAVTYMHPLIVTYQLSLKNVFRNAFLMAVARLPQSLGIRLLHMVPMVIMIALGYLFNNTMVLILLPFVWYVFIGFALSRFVTASYTNAVFDKYINSRIEGVEVNRGLAKEDDDDEEEEDNLSDGE